MHSQKKVALDVAPSQASDREPSSASRLIEWNMDSPPRKNRHTARSTPDDLEDSRHLVYCSKLDVDTEVDP